MRRALFLAVPLSLFSAACTYDNGDARRILNEEPTCPASTPEAVQTYIDADRKLDVQAGHGAGVYIEYTAGGHWLLRTTCDTNTTDDKTTNDVPCAWDIIVTPEDGRSISNVVAEDLESGDSVGAYPEYPSSYQLLAQTTDDIDGMSFDTEPGTAIAVDSFLEGACALNSFFWVGDGAVHTGSPSNPLVLIPSAE